LVLEWYIPVAHRGRRRPVGQELCMEKNFPEGCPNVVLLLLLLLSLVFFERHSRNT